MAEYVIFQLYGPMSSWGQGAGDTRPTDSYPTRSAVVGLVANALGYKRVEEDRLAKLHTGFSWTLHVLDRSRVSGTLTDFHTVQTPRLKSGTQVRSRREALEGQKTLQVVTSLTRREYRVDVFTRVSVEKLSEDASPRLETLLEALVHPVRPLYLGRKSCPVGLMLSPQRIVAEDATAALARYDEQVRRPDFLSQFETKLFAFDRKPAHFDRSHFRRDVCTSPSRWQFSRRPEWVWSGGSE